MKTNFVVALFSVALAAVAAPIAAPSGELADLICSSHEQETTLPSY